MKLLLSTTMILTVATSAFGGGIDGAGMARIRSLKAGYAKEQRSEGRTGIRRVGAQEHITVGGFLTLASGHSPEELASFNPEITPLSGNRYLCRVALDLVEEFAAHEAVASFRIERDMMPKLDRVRKAVGVDRLHSGEVLKHQYAGKGVLCAAVDGGFDPNHVNFLDADGKNRIQNFTYFRPVQSGGCATENYGPDYMINIDTENDDTFHGTHTVGIMAGSYRGNIKAGVIEGDISRPETCTGSIKEIPNPYYGIAYESDLALASGAVTDYYVALGVEEILNYARNRQAELNRTYPVVVNISMGSNVGPHDGSGLMARYLDEAIEDTRLNTTICIASGNEGELPIALHKTFSEGDNTVSTGLLSYNYGPEDMPNAIAGQIYVYSDSDEPFELQALVYNKKRNSVSFRCVAEGNPDGYSQYYYTEPEYRGYDTDVQSPQLAQNFGGYLGVIGYLDTDESGRYVGIVDLLLFDKPENNGDYVILVQATGKPGQRVDYFTDGQLFEFTDHGLAEYGVSPGMTDGTIADTATGRNVIVVGSYNTRDEWASLDGSIYSYDLFGRQEASIFSSWGKLVDGRELPHVCAPGAAVISAVNEYYLEKYEAGDSDIQAAYFDGSRNHSYMQSAGTSMATPVVSGAIALWKEANPELTFEEIREIIQLTAVKDDDVTKDPSLAVKWGAGKFDAFSGLIEVLRRQGIDSVEGIEADPGHGMLIRQIAPRQWQIVAAGASRNLTEVYSMTGVKVASVSSDTPDATLTLDIVPAGVYIFTVNGVHTEKIIVP